MRKKILKRIKSFGYAFHGLYLLTTNQTNAKIHLMAAGLVVCLGLIFNITVFEWCLVLFAIANVFAAEAINTAIEKLTDQMYPQKHKNAAFIKDVAAGAVLIVAIIAAIIGLIIFMPYIIKYFSL